MVTCSIHCQISHSDESVKKWVRRLTYRKPNHVHVGYLPFLVRHTPRPLSSLTRAERRRGEVRGLMSEENSMMRQLHCIASLEHFYSPPKHEGQSARLLATIVASITFLPPLEVVLTKTLYNCLRWITRITRR